MAETDDYVTELRARLRKEWYGYIEYIGPAFTGHMILTKNNLRAIGPFTRENILAWVDTQRSPDMWGHVPFKDFRAVCDDIEISWAKEGSEQEYVRHEQACREYEKKKSTDLATLIAEIDSLIAATWDRIYPPTGAVAPSWGMELVQTPDGKKMWSFRLESEYVGPLTTTDENLLAKLRSIRGQYVRSDGIPIFYHEWVPANHVVLIPCFWDRIAKDANLICRGIWLKQPL